MTPAETNSNLQAPPAAGRAHLRIELSIFWDSQVAKQFRRPRSLETEDKACQQHTYVAGQIAAEACCGQHDGVGLTCIEDGCDVGWCVMHCPTNLIAEADADGNSGAATPARERANAVFFAGEVSHGKAVPETIAEACPPSAPSVPSEPSAKKKKKRKREARRHR